MYSTLLGYIGGEALYSVSQAHPDFEFTLLVRSEEKAKQISAQYPNAKFVYGSLDDAEAIEKAAAAADIVIRMCLQQYPTNILPSIASCGMA